ncbi:hypothetical protein [Ereboglobus luteus]|uniref:Uncharacterized protein n=1 Tax=Ereboglobus luteus TaxID=1796921 RepID=A0A2U8E411_9BACT|nr:hypothetical protein [Ereboglobus luteus]AWI09505.1 hypothetical protein CKA38_09850 [Ereboglobus luteus]
MPTLSRNINSLASILFLVAAFGVCARGDFASPTSAYNLAGFGGGQPAAGKSRRTIRRIGALPRRSNS